MGKSVKLVIAGTLVALVSLVVWWRLQPEMQSKLASGTAPAPQVEAQPEPAPAPEAAGAAKPAPAEAPAQEAGQEPAGNATGKTGAASGPSFDVVRVSPDGQTVIAGRAGPDQEVEILLDGKLVDTAVAGADGAFAAVLDIPPSSEARELVLRVPRSPGSETVAALAPTEAAPEPPAASPSESTGKGEVPAAATPAAQAPAAATVERAAAEAVAAEKEAVAKKAAARKAAAEAEAATAAAQAAARKAADAAKAAAEAEKAAADAQTAEAAADAAAKAEAERQAAERAVREAEAARAAAEAEAERAAAQAAAKAKAQRLAAAQTTAGTAATPVTEQATAETGAATGKSAADQAAAQAAGAGQAEPNVDRYAVSAPVVILPQDDSAQAPVLVKPEAEDLTLLQPAQVKPDAGLVLDRITYSHQGDLIAAGRGRPDATIRVYVNAKYLTEVRPDQSGNWRVDVASDVATRALLLRFDQVDAEGKVISRLETPFDYSPATKTQKLRARRIEVQKGDYLWKFAEQYYGQGWRYSVIFNANSDLIRDPDLIYPGQVFTIPELVESR